MAIPEDVLAGVVAGVVLANGLFFVCMEAGIEDKLPGFSIHTTRISTVSALKKKH